MQEMFQTDDDSIFVCWTGLEGNNVSCYSLERPDTRASCTLSVTRGGATIGAGGGHAAHAPPTFFKF